LSGQLARCLDLPQALAVVAGTVIGSGIFLVPSEMMQAAGSARGVFLAWIAGGILSFFGALTYAELGAMKPQAGGEYVYIRDAYGPLIAFLFSWTWVLIAGPASIATITTGLVRILGSFTALAFLSRPWLTAPLAVSYGQLAAMAAAVLLSWLNCIGTRRAGNLQWQLTLLKAGILLGIAAVGFAASGGSGANFLSVYGGAPGGWGGFTAALVAALWAYDGWSGLNRVAGEIRDPQRNIPRALLLGLAAVTVLYLFLSAAVQYVLPAAAIAQSARPASDAVAQVLGRYGAGWVSAGMAVCVLATLNGTTMGNARVSFALARDGYFLRMLAAVHPRYGTPAAAIILQCALACALLLAGGSFRQFFSLTIFAEWLFYMIAASTVFVFRRREPARERPYRVPGYPVVPATFVAAAAALLYFSSRANLRSSLWGCAVMLAGVPAYFAFALARRRQPAPA
jgi:APA family basic amino acid/polyamine antiporter